MELDKRKLYYIKKAKHALVIQDKYLWSES